MRAWLAAAVGLAALAASCAGPPDGPPQYGHQDATHGTPSGAGIKIGHRVETRFPVLIGNSLCWVGETHKLAAHWQTPPVHSLFTPTVGLLDLDTGVAWALKPGRHREARQPHEYCWQPVPSHNGRWVAYSSFPNPQPAGKPAGGALWVRSLKDGSESQVAPTSAHAIQWTPNDSQLVYSSDGLWRLDLASKRTLQLDPRFVGDLAISPSGKLLAYMVWTRPGYELWVTDLRDDKRWLVAADGWSPSWHGTVLWYVTGNEPWKGRDSSWHGFGRTITCVDMAEKSQTARRVEGPAGTRLAYARMSPDGRCLWVSSDEGRLWLVDSQGRQWLIIAERDAGAAAWSPDGRRLAWSRLDRATSQSVVSVHAIIPNSR